MPALVLYGQNNSGLKRLFFSFCRHKQRIFAAKTVLMRSLLFFAVLITLFSQSCTVSRQAAGQTSDLARLVNWMSGSFNSAAQAQRDTDYFDISLHMHPIWPQLSNDQQGYWLYVEQAMSARADKPYRQRIYKVEKIDAQTFRSSVFLIPEESKYIGAWRTPQVFDALTPSQLDAREGCAVHLSLQPDGSFQGSTLGKGCESTLRGATYASSKVSINNKGIDSWDQGFNAQDAQVWGATKGGYEFRRQE